MHAGTITWNGLDLSLLGKPKLTISRQPDPPAPAFPTREIVTLKVTVDLEALDPGTIQARVEHLQASMRVTDGILRSAAGSGHALEWLAVPTGDNLAQAMTGTMNSLEMGFQAVENHGTAALEGITAATFTPAGGAPLTLHAVRDQKEDISPEHHSPLKHARKRTNHTVSFTARVAQSNPADPLATRLAYLQAQAAAVNALDCREGLLVYGALNRIVRVTEFTPLIDEGRGALDVRVQCFYTVLPDDTKAEAGFDIRTRREAGSGEKVLTFSGTIEAETREIALAKLEAIRQAQMTAGRRMTAFETGDRATDGADTEGVAGGDWTGSLSFTMEVREPRSGSHYNLKVSSSKDIRSGMRWNYSGSVTAATDTAALAIARGLVPATSHPVRTRSEEAIERVSDIHVPESGPQGAAHFAKLDFTYEFEGPADGFIGGELTTDRNTPLFGEHRRTVSGFLVAATREAAEGRMTALLAGEGAAIDMNRKWTDTYLDEDGVKRVFQKLDFSASSRETRGNASVKYSDSVNSDVATMLQKRDVSGTIWTDTEGHADTVLAELITALFGGTPPTSITTTDQRERWGNPNNVATTGGNSAWVQMDFQMSHSTKLTGTVGHDIIEASLSMERTGSLNQTVITAIPYGRPVAEPGTGYVPGTITINATCKAVNQGTARTWVQGKRALVDTIGTAGVTRHETSPPRETVTPEHAPFSGTDVTTWTFTGSYGWTFTGTVLDGIWSTGI